MHQNLHLAARYYVVALMMQNGHDARAIACEYKHHDVIVSYLDSLIDKRKGSLHEAERSVPAEVSRTPLSDAHSAGIDEEEQMRRTRRRR